MRGTANHTGARASTAIQRVYDGLVRVGARPEVYGTQIHATCPVCDGDYLRVRRGHDGRVLLKCTGYDGCTNEEIVAALNLRMSDLFDRPAAGSSARKPVLKVLRGGGAHELVPRR